MEEFDDKHKKHEMVYDITKDDVNKRLTHVFRGTDLDLAIISNMKANLRANRKCAIVPDLVKGIVKNIHIHAGFYDYIMNLTKNKTDAPDF